MEDLRELPTRMAAVESQILQLREEIHVGFSAIRNRFDGVDQQFKSIDQQFKGIDQQFDETRRYMQMLHEDLVARISMIRDGG